MSGPRLRQRLRTWLGLGLATGFALSLGLGLGLGARMARAQTPPQAACQLREVEGQKGPPSLDPRLEDVKALLAALPFSSYKLLETHPLVLRKGAPERGELSNHHRFEITFAERVVVREGKSRLRLHFEISNADGKRELSTTFLVDEGGAPFSRAEQKGDRVFLQLIGCRAG